MLQLPENSRLIGPGPTELRVIKVLGSSRVRSVLFGLFVGDRAPGERPPVPLRSRLPSLRSSFVPPLVVSRFVSADGQSTSLRTRRTPVASSQTSQAANPRSPTKIS